MNTNNERRHGFRMSDAVYIAVCALPAVITILFYSLRGSKSAMEWASEHISAPVRNLLGLFSSVYPFSVMEIAIIVAGVWLIFYIIKSIIVSARRRERLKILLKRLLTIVVAVLYVWGIFCWLWNSGYHAPGFAEKNGFKGGGVSAPDLAAVTWLFAEKANELSQLVTRDEDGHYIGNRSDFFDVSTLVYSNITDEFPCLEGLLYRPKSMLFSWLMSRTGYTGVYFALTGESNINTRAPLVLMPATIAHELAHQRGVAREDEANFVGILACVTSEYTAFEYAGYLLGLIYLRNALFSADPQAGAELSDSLCLEVNTDLSDNNDYWQSQETVNTGVVFFDNILTTLTDTVSDAVNSAYDGYLHSQNQELGLRSYGACVDLLVEYYAAPD